MQSVGYHSNYSWTDCRLKSKIFQDWTFPITSYIPSVQPPCPCCNDCTISRSKSTVTWSPICNPWPVARLAGLVSPEYNDRDWWTGWLTQYDLWAPFFTGTYIISHQRPVHDIDKKFSLRFFSDFILNPCSNRFPWFGPTENNLLGIWPSISIHSVCSLSRNIFYHQTARKNYPW